MVNYAVTKRASLIFFGGNKLALLNMGYRFIAIDLLDNCSASTVYRHEYYRTSSLAYSPFSPSDFNGAFYCGKVSYEW